MCKRILVRSIFQLKISLQLCTKNRQKLPTDPSERIRVNDDFTLCVGSRKYVSSNYTPGVGSISYLLDVWN